MKQGSGGGNLRDTEIHSLTRSASDTDGQDKRTGRHSHLPEEFRKENNCTKEISGERNQAD